MDPLTSGISAGAGIIGSAISSISGARLQKRQFKENRFLVDQQWERNLEQWERENAYNSPQAQLERIKQAGLNPRALNQTGPVASASSPQADRAESPDYSSNVDRGIRGAQAAAEQALNVIALRKARADARTSEANADISEEERDYALGRRPIHTSSVSYDSDGNPVVTVGRTRTGQGLVYRKAEKAYLDNALASSILGPRTEEAIYNTRIAAQRVKNLEQDYHNAVRQGNKLEADAALSRARAELVNHEVDYYKFLKGAGVAGNFANLLIKALK